MTSSRTRTHARTHACTYVRAHAAERLERVPELPGGLVPTTLREMPFSNNHTQNRILSPSTLSRNTEIERYSENSSTIRH